MHYFSVFSIFVFNQNLDKKKGGREINQCRLMSLSGVQKNSLNSLSIMQILFWSSFFLSRYSFQQQISGVAKSTMKVEEWLMTKYMRIKLTGNQKIGEIPNHFGLTKNCRLYQTPNSAKVSKKYVNENFQILFASLRLINYLLLYLTLF